MARKSDVDGQMSLLEYMDKNEKDPVSNSTCVVVNEQCENVDWQDLFDGYKYDELRCVTYVSSAAFFFKATKGFKTVQMIIGIDKEDPRRAFKEGMKTHVNSEGTIFFEKLSDGDKQKLIDHKVEIRYSKPSCIIHSKFYLLSNSTTGDTRLIFGSANFSNSAFDSSIPQYEDVVVYDNHGLFDIYKRRFSYLYDQTDDYVPCKTIENYKAGNLISVMDLTPEEKTDNLIEYLKQNDIVPICNEKLLEYVQEVQSEDAKENAETRAVFEVIESVGKRKKGDKSGIYEIKSQEELKSVKSKIIDILFRNTKTEQEFNRFSLTYNDPDKRQYILYRQNGSSTRAPELFDREASPEEIKNSVLNLTRFIEAYDKFVSGQESNTQHLSRVFEAILYAFASAYVFKLRHETKGNKADIPVILVIGGRAASGKSNMLAYIDRILSGRDLSYDKHFFQYKDVDKGSALRDLFTSDNTYPLLIDEVSMKFFKSTASDKGEELIKFLANTLDNKHPVMICTTNTTSFNIPAQVARRVYFLKVDTCFDDTKKSEANKYYDSVMGEANNLLFRDFCFRMGERIKAGDSLFTDNSSDYLGIVREIFKKYYELAQVQLPKYFPEDLYRDYDARGRELWRTLYTQARNSFVYDSKAVKGPTLTVNLKEIVTGDTQVYMNYLKQEILVEDAGVYKVLRAKPFYEWIDVKRRRRLRDLLRK